MDPQRRAGARTLRRLRISRGWSWSGLSGELRRHAAALRITRIAAAHPASVRRTIARWEAGSATPDEQYRLLLGHAYAHTPLGAVSLGSGSDFDRLLTALALLGVGDEELDELRASVAASAAATGINLLASIGASLRERLSSVSARPATADLPLVGELDRACQAVDGQIGSVPFARLHLAQTAIVDACRRLLREVPDGPVKTELRKLAARSYALAARIAFEVHDDKAALRLYGAAVTAAGEADLSQRALIRSSQTMVTYYSTGSIERARRIADAAARDARRGASALMRARAHALQAEVAARGAPPQRHRAQAALHQAWHDLNADTDGDPMPGAFSHDHLRGFEGICGIFLGSADTAARQLETSARALTRPRETVQRTIVLADLALARLHQDGPGAPEAAADQLHQCVDLTAATRARVPAQRLRQARLALRPWRGEAFVAELDDHLHTALIGT